MWDLIQLGALLLVIFAVANRASLVNSVRSFFGKAKQVVDTTVDTTVQAASDPSADTSADTARQAVIELGRNAWDWDLEKLYQNAWAIHEPNALAQLADAYRARDQAKIDELQKRLNKRLFNQTDKPTAEGGEPSAKP